MSYEKTAKMTRAIRGGFTLIELLIVTAMIILLLSILIVAVNRASRTAQITNTRALMNSINSALVRFRDDVGYLPPVLGVKRELDITVIPDPTIADPPNDTGYVESVQNWYSVTSLAEYLLGYGEGAEDGYGYVDVDEVPTVGIRDPGTDAVWGATLGNGSGTLGERSPSTQGKRFGPYLQLKDERLIGGLNNDGDVVFPGEDTNFDTYPKVITDYWGRPIRYYRTVYKPGAIKYPYRAASAGGFTPTLADVFVLRPWEVKSGAESDSPIEDALDDPTASFELKTAAFALFSPGPDRSHDEKVRADVDDMDGDNISGENEDNIVEVGS